MSTDKYSLEVDSKFLENLFGLVDSQPPKEVTLDELNGVVEKLKTKISNLALSTATVSTKQPEAVHNVPDNPYAEKIEQNASKRPKSVLIVDDLGIITYQLNTMFKKLDFEVVISQEINDAIDKFKKQDFGYAVIDLFIPTDREGFILLDELKKLALLCNLNTRLVVMTASSKSEYRTKCLNRGADAYVEKTPGWQDKLLEACFAD